MVDEHNSNHSKKPHPSEKNLEESHCPGRKLVKKQVPDIINFVRSIQRAEGDPDCFRSLEEPCMESDCSWYGYCQENDENER